MQCQKKHLHQQKWCQLNTLELCNANGNDVTVMIIRTNTSDDAILTEETKARLEAELVDVEAELANI